MHSDCLYTNMYMLVFVDVHILLASVAKITVHMLQWTLANPNVTNPSPLSSECTAAYQLFFNKFTFVRSCKHKSLCFVFAERSLTEERHSGIISFLFTGNHCSILLLFIFDALELDVRN